MSFAHPDLLHLLWLCALVPLLYVMRRPARTVVLPHLFLWQRVMDRRDPRRRRRLRQLLSILLQMLMIATFVLAWAGPGRSHKVAVPLPTLFVVDTSLSMGAELDSGERRMDLAMHMVQERIENAPGPLEWSLVAAGEKQHLLVPLTTATHWPKKQPEPQVGGLFHLERLAQYLDAFRREQGLFRCVIITDLCHCEGDWESLAPFRPELVIVPRPGRNGGLVDFRILRNTHRSLQFDVAVGAFGHGPSSGVIRLLHEGRELVRQELTCEPGKKTRVSFDVEVPRETWLQLKWDAEGDVLGADDVLEFWSAPSPLARVLVVGDMGPHLRSALEALSGEIDPEAASQTQDAAWKSLSAEYDLVILVGRKEKEALLPGAWLLVNSWAPGLPLRGGAEVKDVSLVRQDSRGTLLRGLDLRDLEIRRARAVEADDTLDVLLEGTSGPLISQGQAGDVRFFHLAFDLDPANSSLVLLPAFPLLLKDAVTTLVRKSMRTLPVALSVGEAAPEILRHGDWQFFGRGGGESAGVRVNAPGRNWLPGSPGRLIVRDGAGAVLRAGINVSGLRWSDVFGAGPRPVFPPARQGPVEEREEDISWWFLATLLGLLLLEWLTFNRGWTR